MSYRTLSAAALLACMLSLPGAQGLAPRELPGWTIPAVDGDWLTVGARSGAVLVG